jgi:hypothetical protein
MSPDETESERGERAAADESAQKTKLSPVLPEAETDGASAEAERPPERAAFLDGFPRDPDLDALVEAFVSGNYGLVRSEAPRVAERTLDPRVKAAALELRQRIEPDPLARYILLASMALLLVLAVIAYVTHGGHAP